MRLFLVQHLLVFISVLSLSMAQTALITNGIATTTVPTTTSVSTLSVLPFDPCNTYTVLDDSWRSSNNRYTNQPHTKLMCDGNADWVGWYRLYIHGQSVQMADTCVAWYSCGTVYSLWLSGGHPAVEDGVVTRNVCGSSYNDCCSHQSTPIRVKACPGDYYVYEFVKPSINCSSAYCADARNFTATPVSTSAAPEIFYSFGSAAADSINPADDDGSSFDVQLLSQFPFFGRRYHSICVNNNGYILFSCSSPAYIPYSFPANGTQDIIAGLWTDLDNRARGVVSYNQYTSGNVLTRTTQDINNHFPNLNFNASWVFVATWDKVAYYALTNTETSFQVVLISDSNYSFVLMNYGDIAVTGYPVEAGYDTISSTNYSVIPGSNNGSSIPSLGNSSNVNVPGRWAFMVDSGLSSHIAPQIFYPFGSAARDTNSPYSDDGSSSVIELLSPFVFFGRTYQHIYVNNNGFLTFNRSLSVYVPTTFPANGSQDIIAGLWTDLDNRARGVVSYHQYTSGNVLTRATQDINNYFPNLNFNASWVMVATWDKVAYYPLTNTAGYDTIFSTNYSVIPGSISGSSISNLSDSSNVNVPGRWAFRVDGGINPNIDTIIGLKMKLFSYLDLSDSGNIQTVLQQIKQELVKYGLPNSIELKLRKLRRIKP